MKSFVQRNLGFPLKAGGVLGGITGFVGDVLQPIAPFGFYIAAFCVVVLLVILLSPNSAIKSDLSSRFSDYWYGTSASSLISFSLLAYTRSYCTRFNRGGDGLSTAKNTPGDRHSQDLSPRQATLKNIS